MIYLIKRLRAKYVVNITIFITVQRNFFLPTLAKKLSDLVVHVVTRLPVDYRLYVQIIFIFNFQNNFNVCFRFVVILTCL